MPESTYSVYLVQREGEQGGEREVTSPVTGHRLEFYDTGVWLDRETGRNFFPYEQIRTIHEGTGGEGSGSEHSGSEGGTPERSESGAEEDMLEEEDE